MTGTRHAVIGSMAMMRGPRPLPRVSLYCVFIDVGPRPTIHGQIAAGIQARPKAQGPRPKAQGPRPKDQGPRTKDHKFEPYRPTISALGSMSLLSWPWASLLMTTCACALAMTCLSVVRGSVYSAIAFLHGGARGGLVVERVIFTPPKIFCPLPTYK